MLGVMLGVMLGIICKQDTILWATPTTSVAITWGETGRVGE